MATHTLPSKYDFKASEEAIYKMWEKNGYFKPWNDPNKPDFDPNIEPFVISIPPPNVTGELHLGHAMFVSMEDLMIRYHRMKGHSTLWVPGTDHAGIATQLQIEKSLVEEGMTREEIGREAFLERTWEWKHKYGGIIIEQIRRLGASCDWSRERFTLDDTLSRAVREAFVRLYEKGLIYRGPRLINWSPGLRTAVSDLEVEYSEEPGTLYFFKYMLVDFPGEYIPVATTRPETILGDTGLAVHPEDPRYQKYIGAKALVPILGREIPVIADEYVDREFGTGALKITPGHDPHDYEIGQRHNLAIISVLDEIAQVNEHGGPYEGLDRFVCREKLWEDMRNAGLVIKEESYTLNVPRSQRGGEIIEPMVSTQWFMRMETLAAAGLDAVRTGRINIIPERFAKVYYNWLENIQDWCISRQLWWGHRIPVWYCDACSEVMASRHDPEKCPQCGTASPRQDPDVLDTWFSSALWPFSTLGWPEQTADLKYFYPTSVMETGYDILFFWVARMIMTGVEFTEDVPFHTVYLHGLIRDENGRKMSKTAGNVIDPLEVMDELGTDALRFTLLVGSTPGKDVNVSLKKVEANRNFANKVWNATRFILGVLTQAPKQPIDDPDWTLADSWIWAKLQTLIRDVERLFQKYHYGEAGRHIYDFFWGDFADWYLEIAKLQVSEGGDRQFYTAYTLTSVLDLCLRLLHPFTPYVTEELWGHLKRTAEEHSPHFAPKDGWPEALIVAAWPEPRTEEGWEPEKVATFALIQEVVRAIRNLRSERKVTPGVLLPATIVAPGHAAILNQKKTTITTLARLNPDRTIVVDSISSKPSGHIPLVIGNVEVYLPLEEIVDVQEERQRLNKELIEVENQIQRLETLLTGPFVDKAPAQVVQKERDRLSLFKETATKLQSQLESLAT